MAEALRIPGMIHVKAMCLFSRDGKTLATRHWDEIKQQEFHRVIGGGMHFQETAEDAVRREVREELGSEIDHVRFLEVVENIFTNRGVPGHEIVFLFSGELRDESLYTREEIRITETSSEVSAFWIPVADVLSGALRLYPTADYATHFAH